MIETEIAVIGGGIVGLAVAREVLRRNPGLDVALIEKEDTVAAHQSGRNSGVIHSGIYYAPGSTKATLARAGCESIKEYCREHGIPCRTTGKLIVASSEGDLPGLQKLHDRARANSIECSRLDSAGAREIEPAVSCLAALLVPSAGVVDYGVVAAQLRQEIELLGCRVILGTEVNRIDRSGEFVLLHAARTTVRCARMINAGGLFSDRLAALDGVRLSSKIIPFRGEYFELRSSSSDLVRGLIYPVPDVRYPFLGIHLTRSINDVVHAGPNAVLALSREGYRWRDVSIRDTAEVLGFLGFWRFISRHLSMAAGELSRSVSRRRFAESVRALVPSIRADDLRPSLSGVRAQALGPSGKLIDDFLIEERDGAVHVLNAPSPAATSSLEIARTIVDRIHDLS